MKTGDAEFLAALAEEMRQQDNLATAHPVWMIEEKMRVYGVDPLRHDPAGYVDDQGGDASEDHPDACPYIEQWVRLAGAVFATHEAAKWFITRERYNHGKMRTYCASMHRAPELRQLFEIIRENF